MVSIIIPNYNKANFIQKTIQSVIAQTHENWEAIIVDDGSTDQSIEIIKQYCKQDKRFRLFERNRQPKGGSTCRNIGLKNAQGNYTMFLDSDDILTPNCLSNRLNHIKQNPDHHFLVFSGGTFYRNIGDSNSQWIPSQGNHAKQFLAHILPWNISLPIWKTSFLKRLNGFDETFPRLQDVELHTRALLQPGVKYKIIGGAPDFYYRIDEKRKLKAPYQFVETFIKAVELYSSKMKQIIKVRNDKAPLFKALNGTFQSAYLTAQVQYDLGNISAEERNRLFDRVKSFHNPKGLFTLYIKGLQNGIHRIKGYNWLGKKVLAGR
ncbi:glycosyltransferase family 2 protein [Marinilabilia salmonicolor]|uniref:glycosyltransferase family 2 protein n=1 Tax=Marinilabilia salmonicolor TaxID=989 RepID=UPI0015E6E1C5|nr:glycosyltransferase family 2 protein [Marinilabilia salmonicolor]